MPTPFQINFPNTILDDLQYRLRNAKLPTQIEPRQWTAGTPLDLMQKVLDYWIEEYDWRDEEAKLNKVPQYKVSIDGIDLHFAHIRSRHDNAIPLILTHGWPSTFADFVKLIPLLTDPADPSNAFHVVIPSLPGYAFSSTPTQAGWHTKRIAALQHELMQTLGYAKYGVQGGDWGAVVSTDMARQEPESVLGLHLTMVTALPPGDVKDPMSLVEPHEMEGLNRMAEWQAQDGYFRIQSTQPDTLGFAMHDSPVGLAAWIIEKFYAWSDCKDEDVLTAYTMEELLNTVMLYWCTGSVASSFRLYYEQSQAGMDFDFVKTPTAGALFKHNIMMPPRKWAEKQYNIQQWNVYQDGGHFPAIEQPELLASDIAQFFASRR